MKNCAKGIPEVSLRLAKERCQTGTAAALRTPADAVDIMRKVVGKDAAQESFVAVFLGARNEVLASQRVSLGALDQTVVDPKVLFAGAMLAGAKAMLIGHNHPSGNLDPSSADDQMTQQLISGARVLGVQLLDHIIFSDTDSYSYVQHGRLKFN